MASGSVGSRSIARSSNSKRAGIAVGIERGDTRHRAQRKIVCAEAGRRLMQRVIDLGQPQALLKRRSDPDGEVFPVCSFVAQDIVGAMRPELAAVSVSISRKVRRACGPDPLIAPVN